mgnify:CR=1 FL=1
MPGRQTIENAYTAAREQYAALGIDTEQALERLAGIPISVHCWQGDDVSGFENPDAALEGGIQATGNYPGKARTPDELRADLDQVFGLLPGKHRLNLHAIYLDTGGRNVDRNEIGPEHFASWVDWARERGLGMDFNGTFFSHPKASDGFTLAHRDPAVRNFWIEHAIACRKIGEYMGRELGSPSVVNVWVPDGYKDTPADRKTPRELLKQSLDKAFAEKLDRSCILDSVESKLFGIGAESYTVGSHEFYLAYSVANDILLCLDSGHFHPTEIISDKISAVLTFLDDILLHVSRGVRWDSDHVVTFTEELQAIAREVVRGGYEKRVHIGLDFFDASINRVAAWAIGARNAQKALLMALLEPQSKLQTLERDGDFTARLALLEDLKAMPFGAVWNAYCLRQDVAPDVAWLDEVKEYEKTVLAARS